MSTLSCLFGGGNPVSLIAAAGTTVVVVGTGRWW